jgi:hypothetical protein
MKKNDFLAMFVLFAFLVCGGTETATAQVEETGGSDMVSCADGMLKVDAPTIKPEDLVRDIGDKCGIKIVVFGEAFDEKPIGVKFQQMPVRMGIQRVLRIANMPNFVLHFDNSTSPRIVELDIMGKKGGERQLTSGAARPASSVPASAPPPGAGQVSAKAPEKSVAPDKAVTPEKRDDKKPSGPDPKDLFSDKAQEDFMRVMDDMMKAQESGEEPDPAEVLRIFNQVVPPEIREQIPPDVLKEIEEFEKNPQPVAPPAAGGTAKKKK